MWTEIAAGLSLLLSGIAVWSTHRHGQGQVAEARKANQRLDRLEKAAEAAARVTWDLQATGHNAYALFQRGPAVVRDVVLSSPSAVIVDDLSPTTLGAPGGIRSIRFRVATSPFVGQGAELHVTWAGGSDTLLLPMWTGTRSGSGRPRGPASGGR